MDIKGYRQLSEAEIALINRIKEFGSADIAAGILAIVADHIAGQRAALPRIVSLTERSREQQRLDYAQPERWLAIARTHFQEGLMALTRAVAQPGSF